MLLEPIAKPNLAPYAQPAIVQHSYRLAVTFERLLRRSLMAAENIEALAELLYNAPFALVSHGNEAEPVLNYANLTAQRLWKIDWENITRLPSRLTAEPLAQSERQQLLERVRREGYIDDYSGIRIATDGSRFRIDNATVWNVTNETGRYIGQAAMFTNWQPLAPNTTAVMALNPRELSHGCAG